MRDIRVCILGDEGVGKSSLISAFIKETFVSLAPRTVLPEVTIPPSVSPDHDVTMVIVDTSPRQEDRPHLENEIRKAHVVAIVYAIDNPTSFDRIPTYWLPTIRSLGVNVPVLLVGNKIDLRVGVVDDESLKNELVPIMQEYKEVETCIETSAKAAINLPQLFYFSQNAVLHPTAPLYDSRLHTLKPSCTNALSRIFKLCDHDKDSLLSDEELNEFQRIAFNQPLRSTEIEGIKEVIYELTEGEGLRENRITEAGFIALHTRFIQKGRLETTWKTLRRFGYGEDLQLREDFLHPRLDIPTDCSVELSPQGYAFFTDLFEVFDKDSDGALSPTELDLLFSTSPGIPWLTTGFPESTVTNDSGWVTLQGWLAQWSMTTLLDYKTTLGYLAYLGYPFSSTVGASGKLRETTSALTITKPAKQERLKGTVNKNVLLAYVLGAAGSGKTSLLNSFVGKPLSSKWIPTSATKTVVNSVEIAGIEKYLILQEFGSSYESEVLKSGKKLGKADVLVMVYDSADTNSFSYLSNIRGLYWLDEMPTIFVATKSDLDLAQQRHEVQPDTYCTKLSLPIPLSVSLRAPHSHPGHGSSQSVVPLDLFHTIVRVAIHPLGNIPYKADKSWSWLIPSSGGYGTRGGRGPGWVYGFAVLVGGAAVGVGILSWRGVSLKGWLR